MRIAIGTDHGGLTLKEAVKTFLAGRGIEVLDMGAHTTEPSDYPDFAFRVAEAVSRPMSFASRMAFSLCYWPAAAALPA